MEAAESIKVLVLGENGRKNSWDVVPAVEFFDLFVNGKKLAEIKAMPFSLPELAVGYLLSNAFIDDPHIVENVYVEEGNIKVTADSEFDFRYEYCKEKGVLPIEEVKLEKINSNYSIPATTIDLKISKAFSRASLQKNMAGVHFAVLADDNGLLFVAEDFYPESAMYKVVGKACFSGFDFRRAFLFVSWPICPETVVKASILGIPIVGSDAGVSNLAIHIANKSTGQTVFTYNGELKVYSHPKRII